MAYRGHGVSFGFGLTPMVKALLIANTVIYLAMILIPVIGVWLAFIPSMTLVRPWGVVTYMFVHGGFFHLFFNMLILFFFGPPLEGMWGSREFLKFYIISGLGGAALSYLFAYDAAVVGASAAIYGVMLAFALNWPDMPIHIWGILPVKAKWLVAFLAVVAILSSAGETLGTAPASGTAHFAHLGGFAAAFLYLRFNDQLTDRVSRLRKFVSKRRLNVAKGQTGDRGSARAADPRRRPRSRRDEDRVLDEVDRVLDKISESGLQSLTDEEKSLLDEVSRKYRQN
ncbi:MAG TPA: rhomboid family intramembrane serine protease [Longimicrobiales bacterium]|nr:rhomboid family intramembrane serine protease [Longimicrobiales bacterium]